MPMLHAEASSSSIKKNYPKGMLRKEFNQHRMTQSTLSAPPELLRTDRHRFILERLGQTILKLNKPHKDKPGNIQTVPTASLKPALPGEKNTYNMMLSDTKVSLHKIKFDWTMMPPVKSAIACKFGEGEKKLSQGIVYKINTHQIVHAPVNGVVIFSGIMKEFEHVVMIEKDFENTILVAGISNADIKQGDKVYRGQKIGTVIKDKWIYVEFRNAGVSIDPQQVLVSGKVNEE